MYYRAWLVLKDDVSSMPPKLKDPVKLDEEETEEKEANGLSSDMTVPDNPNYNGNVPSVAAFNSDLSVFSGSVRGCGHGHGSGPGRSKTKMDALQAKYIQSKMKNMDAMVITAKQKAKEMKHFVCNNARTNACKIAYTGYHGAQNSPIKAKYEKMLQDIMNAQSSEAEEAHRD
jgi:hypothetical protein